MPDDREDAMKVYSESGGQVEQLPPGKKPKESSVVYPFSGGHVAKVRGHYGSERENSPALKLLKMTPKGLTMTGGSGAMKITSSDVSGALGMKSPVSYENTDQGIEPVLKKLSSEAYYFGLAKYLGDNMAVGISWNNATEAAVKYGREQGWRYSKKGIVRNAAGIALIKHIKSGELVYCLSCDGTGQTKREGKCARCDGAGRREPSMRFVANKLGTDHKNAGAVWAARIDEIYRILSDWDNHVLRHLHYQFYKES